jgi:SAM-dependent methyltransferase
MFTSYGDIFEQRGRLYHQAMRLHPLARAEEFQHVIRMAEVKEGDVLCDVPSGGGYLKAFLKRPTAIIHIETSTVFGHICRDNGAADVRLGRFDAIPLGDGSVDKVICLASLHHVEEKRRFFSEAHRILREGGCLTIADVRAGSAVSAFLDGFVNAFNTMGHRGDYIDPRTCADVIQCGFAVTESLSIPFHWRFDSRQAMGRFCQLLFGIDLADTAQVIEGIRQHVGFSDDGHDCRMNWELFFIKASKLHGSLPVRHSDVSRRRLYDDRQRRAPNRSRTHNSDLRSESSGAPLS